MNTDSGTSTTELLTKIYGCNANFAASLLTSLDQDELRHAVIIDCLAPPFEQAATQVAEGRDTLRLEEAFAAAVSADCRGVDYKPLGLLYAVLAEYAKSAKAEGLSEVATRHMAAEAKRTWHLADTMRFDEVVKRGRLAPQAHEQVVSSVMKNALFVLAWLDPAAILATDRQRPSRTEILKAVLKVDRIDDSSKEIVQDVLDVYPTIVRNSRQLPKDVQQQLDILVQRIQAAKSVDAVAKVLGKAAASADSKHEGLTEGLRTSQQSILFGRGTLYSEPHWFYRLVGQVPKPWLRICKKDGEGGVGGAASACYLGAEAGASSAVASAIAGSTGQVIAEIWPSKSDRVPADG